MKHIDVAAQEEAIAQETYRRHLAVDAALHEHLRILEHERESWGRHEDESDRFYVGLGVLLENNVRGLISDWEVTARASRVALTEAREQVLGARRRVGAMR